MGQPTIRVALLDGQLLLLQALATHINAHPDLQVVTTATDAGQGLAQVLATKPDVAVLDVDLPGRGGFDLAAEIMARLKTVRIIFLTSCLYDVFIEQALRVRVSGYLLKSDPIDSLINSIRSAASGKQCFSKEVEERLNYDATRRRYIVHMEHPLSGLTTRQLEVFRRLAKGESVKEVAKTMHLSQKSVDSHKYRIMNKLGIHDRVQLARYAIREGLMLP